MCVCVYIHTYIHIHTHTVIYCAEHHSINSVIPKTVNNSVFSKPKKLFTVNNSTASRGEIGNWDVVGRPTVREKLTSMFQRQFQMMLLSVHVLHLHTEWKKR